MIENIRIITCDLCGKTHISPYFSEFPADEFTVIMLNSKEGYRISRNNEYSVCQNCYPSKDNNPEVRKGLFSAGIAILRKFIKGK